MILLQHATSLAREVETDVEQLRVDLADLK